MSKSDRSFSFKNTLFLGMGIGAAIGLLVAPWEGKKSRKKLVEGSRKVKNFFAGQKTISPLNNQPDVTLLVIESE